MKRLGTLFVFFLLITGGCATLSRDPTDDYSASQLQQMGTKFLAARDFGQALKFLSLAEKKRPNDATIQYDLGLAYYERGLKSDALTHVKKALTLRPNYPEADNALGRFYAEEGQLDLAKRSFEKAINNPFYQTPQLAIYNLGLVYEKKGEPEMALKQYQEAVRLQHNYGAAYYRMGQMLEELRRADEAREAYGNAIEFSPDLVEAHYRYGVMSYTAGELENALYSLNRVVKLAPRSTMAEDARRYLERLQPILPSRPSSRTSHVQPSERELQLDVMTNQDLLNEQVEAALRSAPVNASLNTEYQQDPKVVAGAQASASEPPRKGPPETSQSDLPRTYIVQMGSFLDKDNAEELQQRLRRKGYDTVLKPYHHQVLGQLYVVQLKPVYDPEKASQLMMQVEKEGHGRAIIIETPVK
jgi:type IV pilus assembly protein PilF